VIALRAGIGNGSARRLASRARSIGCNARQVEDLPGGDDPSMIGRPEVAAPAIRGAAMRQLPRTQSPATRLAERALPIDFIFCRAPVSRIQAAN
jgi:hypothetical protein